MTVKIFITGATGYIGGDALYTLYNAHPEYEFTAIVRNSDNGALVAAAYPKIRLVYGTMDDASVLEEESAKADIVIHTADSSDNLPAAQAISKGLACHPPSHPGFWLHTSGTAILIDPVTRDTTFGEPPILPPYDDLEGVSALTSLPDAALHRAIDKVVLATATDHASTVKTAILCPSTIYGRGRGPGNHRSRQVPKLTAATIKRGKAPILGRGLSEWDHVHVADVSDVFVRLVEKAVADPLGGEAEIWGPRGYFLVEAGSHVWGDVARGIGKAAREKGYISKEGEVTETIEQVQAKDLFGSEELTWATNSKGVAKRARKYLGWQPKGKSLEEEIPNTVEDEAKELGLVKGYRETVTGGK